MMWANSSPWVLGYTVVVAPPEQLIARSISTHSMRVLDAIALSHQEGRWLNVNDIV